MEKRTAQRIRYLVTRDGVQLAWAELGTGPILNRAANWISHLEFELRSPLRGCRVRFLGQRAFPTSATTSAAAG